MLQFLFRPWPKHPIDRVYGIETSARARHSLRTGDPDIEAANIGYAGSQPSVVRRALAMLPDIGADTHFFDIGCGKGRVLAVATEFPLGSITGVELSRSLCRVARRNMARIARRHSDRTVAQIVEGDATRPNLPPRGTAVLFLYNPFRAPLVAWLLKHVEAHAAANPDLHVFLIYYNPTHSGLLDEGSAWSRYAAEQIEFTEEDRRVAVFHNASEGLAVWQLRGKRAADPLPGAERRVRILVPDLAAEIEP